MAHKDKIIEVDLEREKNVRAMTISDFYEKDCRGAIYWDLVRNAHLCKK